MELFNKEQRTKAMKKKLLEDRKTQQHKHNGSPGRREKDRKYISKNKQETEKNKIFFNEKH